VTRRRIIAAARANESSSADWATDSRDSVTVRKMEGRSHGLPTPSVRYAAVTTQLRKRP